MQDFGKKLHNLRQKHNLSLRHLGDKLGVSHTFIAQLEKGEKIPNVAMVLKVAQFFNVSTDSLIKDDLSLED